jgi:hypothetical protein
MAMMMNCNNKGCFKYMDPVLDKTDNEVYCTACGNIIAGMTHFTKTQLVALKQYKVAAKSAYAVRCSKCKVESLPKLVKDKLVCSGCNTECVNVSKPFEILIRNAIKTGKQDI